MQERKEEAIRKTGAIDQENRDLDREGEGRTGCMEEGRKGRREEGGGVDSLRGRAPPGIPLQPTKMPKERIIK